MTLGSIRSGDVVRCDVRGDRFFGLVTGPASGGVITVDSLTGRPIPAHALKARQVIGHWRQRKGSVAVG